jgi:molybdenum cofactor cytidylyltransferase
MAYPISAVLLAAGESRRMGANKLLLRVEGRSLVRRAAECLCDSDCTEVLVVLGYEAEAVVAELSGLAVRPTFNPRFQAGMATSIAAGIQAASPNSMAFLIALADMPLMTPHSVRLLLSEFDGNPSCIVAPVYRGRRGHPVLFGSGYRSLLAELEGDRGARGIIDRHREQLHLVAVESASVLTDWDYPADLPDGIEVR